MAIIAYLGTGAWGFCLANLLASNGHTVKFWGREEAVIASMKKTKEHPRFPGIHVSKNLHPMSSIDEALLDADFIVESVTTKGVRNICNVIKKNGCRAPLIITSKGIEQETGLLLPEIAKSVLGNEHKIACVSGPCIADEVVRHAPTTIVAASQDDDLVQLVMKLFTTPYLRVYGSNDIAGVSFGGAMKNIIGIAAGICDGLGYGSNTKSAMMTRGLHEIIRLSEVKKASKNTLRGLSGLGDVIATSSSQSSRNYRFGYLVASGVTPERAKEKIGMVVEGAETCRSAYDLSIKHGVDMPITQALYDVLYNGLEPQEAVEGLFTRESKHEHL